MNGVVTTLVKLLELETQGDATIGSGGKQPGAPPVMLSHADMAGRHHKASLTAGKASQYNTQKQIVTVIEEGTRA